MKTAYLILTHDNPKHFHRLTNALSSMSSTCFVHVDKKTSIRDYDNGATSSVYFLQERVKVYRGHFSHIVAILLMIEKALEHPNRYGRFVLISGTDYPLRSQEYIRRFFEENPKTEFMNITKMPNNSVGKPLSRLYGYNPTPTRPRFYLEIIIRAILKRLHIIPRTRDYQKALGELVPYAGDEWWALTRGACEYIHNFVDKNPKLLNFYKHTRVPDEMFFQTILGNSPFMHNIARNVTYTDWSDRTGSPAWITEEHLKAYRTKMLYADDTFGKGELLFARKFRDESEDIVKKINEYIAENQNAE
ncbi:MAG: beta-1,6-N-acetylglucosaminyltransferase [Clostridiaceae bacterium]|nr:beta-1,6-N-acetylglucosaminyltransferase [Clostridiaceae bacterium]